MGFEIKHDGVFRDWILACGYSKIARVDFNGVFSPMANSITFCLPLIVSKLNSLESMLLTWKQLSSIVSLLNNLESMMFDVETAFFNCELVKEIFMDCPQVIGHAPDEYLLLVKTIYGLAQSEIQYFNNIEKILAEKIGFQSCASDACPFMKKYPKPCICLFHVFLW